MEIGGELFMRLEELRNTPTDEIIGKFDQLERGWQNKNADQRATARDVVRSTGAGLTDAAAREIEQRTGRSVDSLVSIPSR